MSFNLVNLQHRDGTLKGEGKKLKIWRFREKSFTPKHTRLDMTYMFYKYVFNIIRTA